MTISIFKENCCPELVEPQSGTKIFLKNGNRPEDDFPAPRPGRPSRAPTAGRATQARRLGRAGRRGGSPAGGWKELSGPGNRSIGRGMDRSAQRLGDPLSHRLIDASTFRIVSLWTHRALDSAGLGRPPEPERRAEWVGRRAIGRPNWVDRMCRWIGRLVGKPIGRPNESLMDCLGY